MLQPQPDQNQAWRPEPGVETGTRHQRARRSLVVTVRRGLLLYLPGFAFLPNHR